VSSTGSPIQALANTEHYDTILPGTEKIFIFDEVNTGDSYSQATIKIDPLGAFHKENKSPIDIFVGSEKFTALNVSNWNFQPITLNDNLLKEVCKDLAKGLVCIVQIKLKNTGKEPFDFSYLAWRSTKPFELKDGEPLRIPTGGLGKEIHLYYKLTSNNPVNIYAYSNEVRITMINFNYKPEKPADLEAWPFPILPPVFDSLQLASLVSANETPSSFGTFSHNLYYSSKQL